MGLFSSILHPGQLPASRRFPVFCTSPRNAFFVEDNSRRRQFSSTRFLWFEEISSQKQFSSNPNLWRLTIFEDISSIAEKSSKSGSPRQAPKNAIEEKCKYQEISSTKISPTLKISRKTAYIKKYLLHPQLFDEPNRRQIAIF